jgi:hypothetical protein
LQRFVEDFAINEVGFSFVRAYVTAQLSIYGNAIFFRDEICPWRQWVDGPAILSGLT